MGMARLRSVRGRTILLSSVLLLTITIGLIVGHLNDWELPTTALPEGPIAQLRPVVPDSAKFDESKYGSQLREFFTNYIYRPSVVVQSPAYRPFGTLGWELKSKPKWTKNLGEKLCIIDLDNRPFNEENEVFGPVVMSWDNAEDIHGLSLGVLNHWLYAKIHGYKYYYVATEDPADRRSSWMKAPVIAEILKSHDACIYMDSDAIINFLDLPFEWLFNYWEINPRVDAFALAYDPHAKSNQDKFGQDYLNTGFIALQNNPKTFEILKAWWDCPGGEKHKECEIFKNNSPGKPTDQGGFGTFVRYDYPTNIKSLPCTEANGFPESHSGCEGQFIRHLWTGKKNWVKIAVGEQIPGPFLEMFHKQFRDEKQSFYITQQDLLNKTSS